MKRTGLGDLVSTMTSEPGFTEDQCIEKLKSFRNLDSFYNRKDASILFKQVLNKKWYKDGGGGGGCIQQILKKGYHPTEEDIQLIFDQGNPALVQTCVESGVDFNIQLKQKHSESYTLLYYACKNLFTKPAEFEAMVHYCVGSGMDINASFTLYVPSYHYSTSSFTLLSVVAEKHPLLVDCLLEAGADPSLLIPPLIRDEKYDLLNKYLPFVPNPETRFPLKDDKYCTVKSRKMMDLLLSFNRVDLHYAYSWGMEQNDLQLVQSLEPDVEVMNAVARLVKSPEMIELLIRKGAPIDGSLIFHLKKKDMAITRLLIEQHTVDMNVENNKHQTILEDMLMIGEFDIANLIYSKGGRMYHDHIAPTLAVLIWDHRSDVSGMETVSRVDKEIVTWMTRFHELDPVWVNQFVVMNDYDEKSNVPDTLLLLCIEARFFQSVECLLKMDAKVGLCRFGDHKENSLVSPFCLLRRYSSHSSMAEIRQRRDFRSLALLIYYGASIEGFPEFERFSVACRAWIYLFDKVSNLLSWDQHRVERLYRQSHLFYFLQDSSEIPQEEIPYIARLEDERKIHFILEGQMHIPQTFDAKLFVDSSLIQEMIQEDEDEEIPLKNVYVEEMEKVVQFLQGCADAQPKEWFQQLFDQWRTDEIFSLIGVADYLGLESFERLLIENIHSRLGTCVCIDDIVEAIGTRMLTPKQEQAIRHQTDSIFECLPSSF